jgi:hypothetical protein
MTYLELIERVLEEAKRPLSPTEIWGFVLEKGYDKGLDSVGKTPWDTISARLYVSLKSNSSPFAKAGINPVRFTLKKLLASLEAQTNNVIQKSSLNYLEKDLHPLLTYFASTRLNVYTKTISHSKSSKTTFGEWQHPDLVGCQFLFEDWHRSLVGINKYTGGSLFRLLSFELKRELNFSNLRESFFQAVSNSSWANEGYLVASEILKDADFKEKLGRLSSSFGIGIIELNVNDPDESEVLFPSEQRSNLDLDFMNELAQMNSDFSFFLERVNKDTESQEPRQERYDTVLDKEVIMRSFSGK